MIQILGDLEDGNSDWADLAPGRSSRSTDICDVDYYESQIRQLPRESCLGWSDRLWVSLVVQAQSRAAWWCLAGHDCPMLQLRQTRMESAQRPRRVLDVLRRKLNPSSPSGSLWPACRSIQPTNHPNHTKGDTIAVAAVAVATAIIIQIIRNYRDRKQEEQQTSDD